MRNWIRRFLVLVVGVVAVVFSTYSPAASAASEEGRKPIYVSFFVHFQGSEIRGIATEEYSGEGPAPYSRIAKRIMEMCDKYGIKIEWCTTGICVQQLQEDFPDVIERLKAVKMPITRYSGVGHSPNPSPVGRERDLDGLSPEEQAASQWEFETRTLVPSWQWAQGKLVLSNPDEKRPIKRDELARYNLPDKDEALLGGTLAIEQILDVIPMQGFPPCFKTDRAESDGERGGLNTRVQRALGLGSFEPSYNEGDPQRDGPPTSLFRPQGSLKTLQYLATVLPRDRSFYFGLGRNEFTAELVEYLQAHPESFKIVWPDPDGKQWAAENRARAFLKKEYGMDNPLKMLGVEPPLSKLAQAPSKQPRPRKAEESGERPSRAARTPEFLKEGEKPLKKADLLAAVDYLLAHWPKPNHDGDFGGLPYYVEAGGQTLSLAETFDAFVQALVYYTDKRELPETISARSLLGPVDYPQYELAEAPKIDDRKRLGGYVPRELEQELFPPKEVVAAQGLSGDPILTWWPAVVFVSDVNVFDAAYEASKYVEKEGAVPSGVTLWLSFDTGGKERETPRTVNPAELLFAMAQLIQHLNQSSEPQTVMITSIKVIPDMPQGFVPPYSPVTFRGGPQFQSDRGHEGAFIWRGKVSKRLLNAVWTYAPGK